MTAIEDKSSGIFQRSLSSLVAEIMPVVIYLTLPSVVGQLSSVKNDSCYFVRYTSDENELHCRVLSENENLVKLQT